MVAPPHSQRRQRSAFFPLLPPFPSPPSPLSSSSFRRRRNGFSDLCLPITVRFHPAFRRQMASLISAHVRQHNTHRPRPPVTWFTISSSGDSCPLFLAARPRKQEVCRKGRRMGTFTSFTVTLVFFGSFFFKKKLNPLWRSQQSRRSHLGKAVRLRALRHSTSKVCVRGCQLHSTCLHRGTFDS